MTDLERARAHLLDCQEWLADIRCFNWVDPRAETAVLAALSWVWEEQNRVDDDGYVFPRECE